MLSIIDKGSNIVNDEEEAAQDLLISVAADHDIVRRGVRAIIEDQPDWRVIGEASDGFQAAKQAVALRPDLSILGISMPGLNGAGCARRIIQSWPEARILIQAHPADILMIQDCIDAGVRGIVFKSAPANELIDAVRTIASGRFLLPAWIERMRKARDPGSAARAAAGLLTERELELIRAVAEGLSNKEIAARMEVSIRTVETHRARAMEKTASGSAGALVRWAIRNHLIEP